MTTNVLTEAFNNNIKVTESRSRMIQFKSAELLFLIGGAICCAANDFVNSFSSSRNNKPFFVDRSNVDDIIAASQNRSNDDDRFIFSTMRC